MPEPNWERAGRLMKSQMALQGMSTKEVAKRLGVSETTVRNYLRGDEKHSPSTRMQWKICDLFNWSWDYYVGRNLPADDS